MFPASTHKGQAVLSFPDVCNAPATGGIVAIPYPNQTGGSSKATAPKTTTKTTVQMTPKYKTSGFTGSPGDEPGTLKGVLTMHHQKLMTTPVTNTTAWHVAVDNYVLTAADLYLSIAAPSGRKP